MDSNAAFRKNETTELLIDGRIYNVRGADPQQLQRVAAFINSKLKEIRGIPGFGRLENDYKEILIYINLADEYFKVYDEAENLREEAVSRDEELYAVKHDLISTKLKLENALRQQSVLEERLLEYRKNYPDA